MENSTRIRIVNCHVCSGEGQIIKYDDEQCDREDDKHPSSYLANARSFNRGFVDKRKCYNCEGEGSFFEGY